MLRKKEKTAKIITNKEDTGLQSMYNRQNIPKNIPVLSFYQRGGSRNLSKNEFPDTDEKESDRIRKLGFG